MIAIELRNICKSFKTNPIIDHLSFQIEEGEVFGLLGPNGAGKTTLLNMLSGLIVPDSGDLYMPGYRPSCEPYRVQPLPGVVQQRTAFYENLTAWDNLSIYADISGIPRKNKHLHIVKSLTQMQLVNDARRCVGTFSTGMKQRLALSCALLTNPSLLYLDEPTTSITVQERFVLWDYMRSLHTLDRTIVIATPSFEEACMLCDRVAFINAGKLLAIDTPERYKQRYGDVVVELELASPLASLRELEALSGVKRAIQQGLRLSVILLDSKLILPRVITFVKQECEIRDLRLRELRLDEIIENWRNESLSRAPARQ